jgi:hypothetical protein
MFPGYPILKKSLWERSGKYHRELLRGRADFEFILRLLGQDVPFACTDAVIIDKYERSGSVQTSYRNRLASINEIIVASNKNTFEREPGIQREFLGVGYYESAWEEFRRGNLDAARKWASHYSAILNSRPVWPLDSRFLPVALISRLGRLRRCLRKWRQEMGVQA